jgi:hypothetical protein
MDSTIPLAERGIAQIIAEHGANGVGCFATAATAARIAGYERKYVERARASLIKRGWFTVTSRKGGVNRRSLVLFMRPRHHRCSTATRLTSMPSSTPWTYCCPWSISARSMLSARRAPSSGSPMPLSRRAGCSLHHRRRCRPRAEPQLTDPPGPAVLPLLPAASPEPVRRDVAWRRIIGA